MTGHCPDPLSRRLLADASPRDWLDALVNGWCLGVAVPLALELTERDPLASAGCFPGDLVRGLMSVTGEFWSRWPHLYHRYIAVLRASAAARRRLPAAERMVFWTPLESLAACGTESTPRESSSPAPATPRAHRAAADGAGSVQPPSNGPRRVPSSTHATAARPATRSRGRRRGDHA